MQNQRFDCSTKIWKKVSLKEETLAKEEILVINFLCAMLVKSAPKM